MGSRESTAVESYFTLQDRAEDAMDLAAWDLAGIKPNGHLNVGVYFWPPEVREKLDKLKLAVREVRNISCACGSKRRHSDAECPSTRHAARVALAALRVKKCHAQSIADSLAKLVHTKAIIDRSKD